MATDTKGIVKIGDGDYRWGVYRRLTWTRDKNQRHTLLGVAILVEALEPSRRELIRRSA